MTNNINMKKQILTISCLLISYLGIGQDAFFSNFYRSFSTSNPSGIAISDDINLTMLHRSQWMSIVKPFSTSQFEGYYPIRKANTNEKLATVGLSFINERLGDGGYITTNQFALTGAYNFNFDKHKHLAVGLKVGYFNGATDLNGISTGSQFVNGYYNSTNSLGESINNPVVNGLEISPSITWHQTEESGEHSYYVGVTGFNINQPITSDPDLSLVEDFRLPMRMAFTSGGEINFGTFGIMPRGLFMLQGGQSHVILGSDFKYELSKNEEKPLAMALGAYYRMNDAAVLSLKYLSSNLDVGLTYDFTTSAISDPLNTNTGSFEIFLDYKIKQKRKIKEFELIIEVYDQDTKEPLTADGKFKNATIREKGVLFENSSKSSHQLNQKDQYIIEVSKKDYNTESFSLVHDNEEEHVQKVYLTKTIRMFDLELEILDKETNEPVEVQISLVDQKTGKKTELGNNSNLETQLESGKKHTLSLDGEGYDNAILELRYDKYGTLSKTMYVSKTKPELKATSLKIIVLDESTKKQITSTIMAINVTDPDNHLNSLIALNSMPPEVYPLEIGQKFEILVTKEGYFNKTLKINAEKIEDLEQLVELSPIEIGKSIIIDDLHFKTGKTDLDEVSYRILNQLVDFMNQNPTIKVEIAGHTDSDGADSFNQSLSEGRAQSAVTYLNNKGISTERLVAKGYGESQPLAPNDSPEGKAKNRRVELKIIGK